MAQLVRLRLGLPTEVSIRDVKGWNPFVFPMQDTLTFKFAAKGKRPAIELDWYEGTGNKPTLPKGYRPQGWTTSPPRRAPRRPTPRSDSFPASSSR